MWFWLKFSTPKNSVTNTYLGVSHTALINCSVPRHVSSLQDISVTHVTAGQFHSACLDADGRVYTWGWGVHGQLGHGHVEDVSSPRVVKSMSRHFVTQVAAGYAHTIALTREGRVYTWGCGLFGQLGTGNTSKHVRPTRVKLPGRVVRVAAGYFHNLVMLETGEIMTWGANPQILRLEAQQRKKEKLMLKQLEEKRRQEMEAGEVEIEQEKTMESLHPQDSTTTTSDLHLNPSYIDTSNIEDSVSQICAGSQHSALVTRSGQVFTWGRNLEGQLGLGNRQSVKVPSHVTALGQDVVTMISAGADFTCAVSDLGTVYAWGSNASGQLGRIPIEDPASGGQGDNSRVLVMKTTKRIIRLQHGLQNSCDVPRPVQLHSSINGSGIYPETVEICNKASSNHFTVYKQFPSVEPIFSSKLLLQYLHLAIERLQKWMDSENILRLCLMMDNPLAAAKISLVNKKYLQAFDLSLQVREDFD